MEFLILLLPTDGFFLRGDIVGKKYATISKRHKQTVNFFVIQIQPFFQFTPDWYRKGEVRGIVARYYRVLRSILKSRPHLREFLARCKHCHILFLTHPRNAGRTDLGCPFGCRQAHRKKSAIKRSVEYYRSSAGKIKKGYLNARRNNQKKPQESKPEEKPISCPEAYVDETTLLHIQTITSLIEGRSVAMDDIIIMVTTIMRQLSIDKRKRFSYFDSCPGKIPP